MDRFRPPRIALLVFMSVVPCWAESSLPPLPCGWFENPTPANAWLQDRDGEWTISVQGSDSADGEWPTFGPGQWVATNGHYGHGCACLRFETAPGSRTVRRIVSASVKPLAVCRKDPALKEPRQ